MTGSGFLYASPQHFEVGAETILGSRIQMRMNLESVIGMATKAPRFALPSGQFHTSPEKVHLISSNKDLVRPYEVRLQRTGIGLECHGALPPCWYDLRLQGINFLQPLGEE